MSSFRNYKIVPPSSSVWYDVSGHVRLRPVEQRSTM